MFDEAMLDEACGKYARSDAYNRLGKVTDKDKDTLRTYLQAADNTAMDATMPSMEHMTDRQRAILAEYISLAGQERLRQEPAAETLSPSGTIDETRQAQKPRGLNPGDNTGTPGSR